MQKTFIVSFILIVLYAGCRREILNYKNSPEGMSLTGSYSLVENYEIIEGPNTGYRSTSNYTVKIYPDSTHSRIIIDNLFRAYKASGIISGDSLYLSSQKFPYYNDSISLSGHGRIVGDSLTLEVISGGPVGQIKSNCRAKRISTK